FADGPYFAFRLDVAQYNLIHGLATARKRKIYYCTPLYTSRRAIDEHFAKRHICNEAIWIDVAGAGSIADTETHTIVYSGDGTRAALFSSDAKDLRVLRPAEHKPPSKPNSRGFDWEE